MPFFQLGIARFQLGDVALHPGLPFFQLGMARFELGDVAFNAGEPGVGGCYVVLEHLRQLGDGLLEVGDVLLQLPDDGRKLPEFLVQDVLAHRGLQAWVMGHSVQNVLKCGDGGSHSYGKLRVVPASIEHWREECGCGWRATCGSSVYYSIATAFARASLPRGGTMPAL